MPVIFSYYFVLLAIFSSSYSQRRIRDGFEVQTEKQYAVYLLKAPTAPVAYQGWTCGGAIISRNFVITAAACVEDVQHMYVIAGYKNFVPNKDLHQDECTKRKKKRVVFTCVPKDYQFEYQKTENWARADIGVVKVESPYDFTDKSYEKYCSYTPAPITINYAAQFQKPGIDVIALGWGHASRFRDLTDLTNHNQKHLHYAPTRILDKEHCVKFFKDNKKMTSVIRSHMICTFERGNLNDKGEIILKSEPVQEGCITKAEKMMGMVGRMCEEERVEVPVKRSRFHQSKRNKNDANDTDQVEETTRKIEATASYVTNSSKKYMRTPGICQNDHGGPLVTWMGAHEILIGVATLYRLDDVMQCIGPYLFTSTQCNSAFLDCILVMDNETESGRRCEDPEHHAQNTVQRRISWVGHRDGPAQNEIIYKRHQVPISSFHTGQT